MLRVIQNKCSASAKSYYTRSDYLSESQELFGKWGGKLCEELGLNGEVDKQSFDRLCDNLHPVTGQPLTMRTNGDRTVGYDLNFHLPKGVSMAALIFGDDRIIPAFEQISDEIMNEIETDMRTRIRRHGLNDERVTGNGIWGAFTHLTTRPEIDPDKDPNHRNEAEPDPHVHRHCFLFNVTKDTTEGAFKAGQFREIKRDAAYYESMFHVQMAMRMRELGYDIERNGRDWDIAAIGQETKDKFSRRTRRIEKIADELGISSDKEKDQLGAKTRAKKSADFGLSELIERWKTRLSTAEANTIATSLPAKTLRVPFASSTIHAEQSMELSKLHHFERNSVVPLRSLLTHALRHGIGNVTSRDIHAQVEEQGLITREMDRRVWATSWEVIREESQMVDVATRGRNTCNPLNPDWIIRRDWLNADQRHAVENILQSRDSIVMTLGRAGSGKTTLMQEIKDAIEDSGRKLYAFAPSAEASRGVLAAEGFDATTVAELLVSKQLQAEVAGNVILVDEAGLLGTRTMKQTLELADRLDCRVLLVGDYSQHHAVERGSALRILHHNAGIIPAEVKQIQRQKSSYKEAVECFAAGDTDAGMDKLQTLGWIQEIEDDDARYRSLANEFAKSIAAKESVLAIAPTHAESERLTQAIRHELKQRKLIEVEERDIATLKPLRFTEAEKMDADRIKQADTVVFHQNAVGFKRGSRLDPRLQDTAKLRKAAKRFEAFSRASIKLAKGDLIRITGNGQTKDGKRLNNGAVYQLDRFNDDGDIILTNGWTIDRDYGFITQGYVSTSHASQGKTVDRVLIAESSISYPAMGREQTYVSLSRGKHEAIVYTDDLTLLKDAIRRSTDGITATEFMHQKQTELERRVRDQKSVAIASKRDDVDRGKQWETVYDR